GELDASASWFAVYTNANLHIILTQIEGWLARCRYGTGSECHAHAASLCIDFACQCRNLGQRCARLSKPANNFLHQYCNTNTSASRCIKSTLYGNIIVGNDTFNLNPLSLCQFFSHIEVQYIASVVLNNVQDTCTAIDGMGGGQHLIWYGRGEDGTGTGS